MLPEFERDVVAGEPAPAAAAGGRDLEDEDDRWDVHEPIFFLLSWKEAGAVAAEGSDRPALGFTGLYIVSVCNLSRRVALDWVGLVRICYFNAGGYVCGKNVSEVEFAAREQGNSSMRFMRELRSWCLWLLQYVSLVLILL